MTKLTRLWRLAMIGIIGACVLAASPAPISAPTLAHSSLTAANGAWTVYHHDDGHTGYDPSLSKVTSVSTGWTSAPADAEIYASPLIYNGIVYTATLNNTVYALRQADGVEIWHRNLGAPVITGWFCGNVSPQGILGTPVLDVAGSRIYVAALFNSDHLYHVIGLDLATSTPGLDTAIPMNIGGGFDWTIQQQRGALAVRNGYVYVPFGGRAGDCPNPNTHQPYFGWVIAIPTNGSVPNPLPHYKTPAGGIGIWTAGGVVVDDATGNVFAATGNGISTGIGCATANQNDAVVRLNSSLALQDYFMPADWQANWCNIDEDLGSASPLLLSPNLLFQAGKWGGGFLLDANNLGGVGGQRFPTPKPATYSQAEVCFGNHSGATFGSFAYAAPFIYLQCQGSGIVALNTNQATPAFSPCDAACAAPDWHAGGSATFGPPIVAGGAVWAATDNGGLYAFDSLTGAQIFKSANFGINHFVTPAEAGGQVFVPSHTVIRSFNMNVCVGTPLSTSYFNWFDNATPGMVGDNIHILNTGGSTSSGCITVGGQAVNFSVAAGQEQHVTLPAGTIGGPVVVNVTSGPPVLASQRVQYFQSFNEVWALTAAQAAMTSYIHWFDTATPGMVGDNIHVLNPGSSSANVTVGLAGATPATFTLAPGVENHVTFSGPHLGGPVTISSNQPVLASQRVQYYQSFNEVVAQSAAHATTTNYFNWFDTATPGMVGDNVHILNPGGASANVAVTLPGALTQSITAGPGAEVHVTFPSPAIGGPVTVTSNLPVLASQRVQYYQSFNEVPSSTSARAATTLRIMWFDKATPGMVGDNIHVLNPGGTSATVTVTLAGAPIQVVTVGPGAERYVTFPAGVFGGPVLISSTQPVLAAQRVQYFQSFNEVQAG